MNPFFIFKDDPERASQVARAAGLINAAAKFQCSVKNGIELSRTAQQVHKVLMLFLFEDTLAPDVEKTTPLDMSQYTKLFGASR